MGTKRTAILTGLIGIVGLYFILKPAPKPVYVPIDNMVLIAHASGGLPQGSYSNTREGFDLSARNGFTLIETDFNWTENGELVLLRDWQRRHYQYYSHLSFLPTAITERLPRQQAATSAEFTSRKMNYGLHQMRLEDLLVWMQDHPEIRIVTDVKDDNLKALALIKTQARKLAPDLQNRFIPQIYQPEEYASVADMGYEDIIFTAYKSELSAEGMVTFARENTLYALTAPLNKISPELAQTLSAIDTPLYTHTVNGVNGANYLREMGISGLYTDYLISAK